MGLYIYWTFSRNENNKRNADKILEQNKELIKRVAELENKAGKKEKEEILVPNDIKVSICIYRSL